MISDTAVDDHYVNDFNTLFYFIKPSENFTEIDSKYILNDSYQLNKIAEENREDYINWIFKINNFYLNLNLVYNDNISLFFFSDISNNRTEIFDTYNYLCNIIFLKQILNKYKIDEIILNVQDPLLKEFLELNLKIHKSVTTPKSKTSSLRLIFIKTIIFYLKYFIISFLNIFINQRKLSFNRCFISRYPLHYDQNNNEKKYGDLINKNDANIVSILADGFHQNINIINSIKYYFKIINLGRINFVLIDSYAKFRDIFCCVYISLSVFFKFFLLKRKKYFYHKINLSNLINYELSFSFHRIARLIVFEKSFSSMLSLVSVKEAFYHLHEYCFGRVQTYSLSRKNISTIGFQHGPATWNKLVYFIGDTSSNFIDFRIKCPVPQKTLAEDNSSKNIYEYNAFPCVEVLKQIPRYDYLKEFKRKSFSYILIVPGLHDLPIMLKVLIPEILENKNTQYYLKPHPRSQFSFEHKFNNLTIVHDPIIKLLADAKIVYVTYSSVYYECNFLRIPVKRINIPGIIDQ